MEYNQGACDGWLRAGRNDEYAIDYYGQTHLPFYAQAVSDCTVLAGYFCSLLRPTLPNRIYQHAAQTDRLENSLPFLAAHHLGPNRQ